MNVSEGQSGSSTLDDDISEVIQISSRRGTKEKGSGLPKALVFLSLIALFGVWQLLSFTQLSLQSVVQVSNKEVQTADNIFRAVLDVGGFLVGEGNRTATASSYFGKRTSGNAAKAKATIAYAVSLTGCAGQGGGTASRQFASVGLFDGPAVLKHSIHMNSIRVKPNSTKYDYHMIAIVHPDASDCVNGLAHLGYEIVIRDTPVDITKIEGEFLRTHVNKTGCCGEKEFIKLWSYTFDEYPIVVHLDMDSVLFKPLDSIFDAMLEEPVKDQERKENQLVLPYRQSLETCNNTALPPPHQPIKAMFTRDYYMINPGKQHVGMQGGFLVVKPDLEAFDEYKAVILKGDFKSGRGWGGSYGGYFGAQQIQGLVAYFYDALHPNEAAELEYCVYNNMGQNIFDTKRQACRGPHGMVCTDCTSVPFHTVKSGHFTVCGKPWNCRYSAEESGTCYYMLREWFRLRHDVEKWFHRGNSDSAEVQNETVQAFHAVTKALGRATSSVANHSCNGKYGLDQFNGCCSKGGKTGYIPLDQTLFRR